MKKVCIVGYGAIGPVHAKALESVEQAEIYAIYEMAEDAGAGSRLQEFQNIINLDNLSLAIGKKGLNVRLAARLTHYKLDIKTYDQAREEGINII